MKRVAQKSRSTKKPSVRGGRTSRGPGLPRSSGMASGPSSASRIRRLFLPYQEIVVSQYIDDLAIATQKLQRATPAKQRSLLAEVASLVATLQTQLGLRDGIHVVMADAEENELEHAHKAVAPNRLAQAASEKSDVHAARATVTS